MHVGAQIIQRQYPDTVFLTKPSSSFHYLYSNKQLCALQIFETTTVVKEGTDKARVRTPFVDKIRAVCKKNNISGFYIFVNTKYDVMTRIKVSDNLGQVPCIHKVTQRDGEPVNYLFDLSDEKNVVLKQCSST